MFGIELNPKIHLKQLKIQNTLGLFTVLRNFLFRVGFGNHWQPNN